jgi:hypothetical protein
MGQEAHAQVFDEVEREYLQGGRALIVGSASPDGTPLASRGWGFPEFEVDGRVTVLVDRHDRRAHDNLVVGAPAAITATDVHTLRSLQMKGRVLSVGPSRPGDDKVVRAYCDAFFGDIESVDGMHRDILERMFPEDWFRCEVQVEERFDQTPGPKAGAPIGTQR